MARILTPPMSHQKSYGAKGLLSEWLNELIIIVSSVRSIFEGHKGRVVDRVIEGNWWCIMRGVRV